MKKILWLTDTHLTFSFLWKKYSLIKYLKNIGADALFLSGDISNGFFIDYIIYYLANHLNIPIYFVLGNHDYYFKNISNIHNDLKFLTKKYENLHWLTENDVLELKPNICVIGSEGWYDCNYDDINYLKLNLDLKFIRDFRKIKKYEQKFQTLKDMANNSANLIEKKLLNALNLGYKQIYLITHIPPFKEATKDEGTILESFWLPYNANSILGEKIKNIMVNFPDRKLTILCGHTHDRVTININNNIECRTNSANYFNLGFKNKEIILI